MSTDKPMVTQAEAEDMARQLLQSYVNACRCRSTEDVANVLMKVASVAGVFMTAVVGQEEAVARMEGTAAFVANQKPGRVRMERVQ